MCWLDVLWVLEYPSWCFVLMIDNPASVKSGELKEFYCIPGNLDDI